MNEQKIIELQTQIDALANTVTSLQVDLAEVSAACLGLQQQIEENRMAGFVETAALQAQIGAMQSRS